MQTTSETASKPRARKIIWKRYFYGMQGFCPACERLLCYDYDRPPNFCPNCGQALKGGETERKNDV